MVEMKSDMVIAREQIRGVLDSIFAMRGEGGVLPFTVLSTLLGSQDLSDDQINGFNIRGNLQIASDMKFVNAGSLTPIDSRKPQKMLFVQLMVSAPVAKYCFAIRYPVKISLESAFKAKTVGTVITNIIKNTVSSAAIVFL